MGDGGRMTPERLDEIERLARDLDPDGIWPYSRLNDLRTAVPELVGEVRRLASELEAQHDASESVFEAIMDVLSEAGFNGPLAEQVGGAVLEVKRLRAELTQLRDDNRELSGDAHAAREEARRLRTLCVEVANSGVAMEDPRIDYMEIQLDRETWNELRALVAKEASDG